MDSTWLKQFPFLPGILQKIRKLSLPPQKPAKEKKPCDFFWSNKSPPSHCSLFHMHLRSSFSLLHKVCCKTGCFLPKTPGYRRISITDSLKHLHWYFYFQPFLQYFRGVWSSFRWWRDKTMEKEEGMVPPVTRCWDVREWSSLFLPRIIADQSVKGSEPISVPHQHVGLTLWPQR